MNTDHFLSNEQDYDVETYTLKQVMELLKIKQKAVYNLAARGHIKSLDFSHGKRTVYHYTRESVDSFLREKLKYITVSELAEEFNLTKNAVFNCLQKNNISYELDEIHFPRKTAVLTLAQVEHVRDLLRKMTRDQQPRTARKSDFYRNSYGLYQPFTDLNGNTVRLITGRHHHSNEWGFFSNNFFLPLSKALEEGYKPHYEIKDLPTIRSPYAVFTVASYDKSSRVLIDLAYQQLGFRNMYIEHSGNEIHIYLKEAKLQLNDSDKEKITAEWLKQVDKEGFSTIKSGYLEIKSGMQISSYYLKSQVSKWIDEYAVANNLQPGEVIELAMRKLLKENVK